MKSKFKTEVIGKNQSETERLTKIANYELKKERDRNLQAEIEKLNANRKLKGDKLVFKNDEEFKQAGFEILKKYEATEPEKRWFLGLVENKK